jgi:hypothetical protein
MRQEKPYSMLSAAEISPKEEISFFVASPATQLYDVNLVTQAASKSLHPADKKKIDDLYGYDSCSFISFLICSYTENAGMLEFRIELAKFLESMVSGTSRLRANFSN